MSKKLTFAELKGGDKFISFPLDGDDCGHGGYRKGAWLLQKLRLSEGTEGENAVRLIDGQLLNCSINMEVYIVLS